MLNEVSNREAIQICRYHKFWWCHRAMAHCGDTASSWQGRETENCTPVDMCRPCLTRGCLLDHNQNLHNFSNRRETNNFFLKKRPLNYAMSSMYVCIWDFSFWNPITYQKMDSTGHHAVLSQPDPERQVYADSHLWNSWGCRENVKVEERLLWDGVRRGSSGRDTEGSGQIKASYMHAWKGYKKGYETHYFV